MKTLLVTLEYPPAIGGVASYYANLAKHWPAGQKFFVLGNKDSQLVNRRYPVFPWLAGLGAIGRKSRQIRPDHILVGQILPLGTAVYFLTRFQKIPYSVFLHGMDFSLAVRGRRKRILSKKILMSAQNIICASSYTAHLVKDFLPPRVRARVKIVNPGVSRSSPPDNSLMLKRRRQYDLGGKLVLFSLGRLVERKGFDLVIRAMPEILTALPEAIYFIAGSGPDSQRLRDLAKKLPAAAQKRLIFLGQISEAEKWVWLSLADIFLMPAQALGAPAAAQGSRLAAGVDFEGFGIVYLEANLAGTPVIAADSGGVRDAVVDGQNGILLKKPGSEELIKAVVRLGLDEGLRRRLGEQGRARAEREFSWPAKARQIYEIIY